MMAAFVLRNAVLSRLIYSPIKPYIPCIWRYSLDFLTSEGNAKELRFQPLISVSEERKTPVVVAATHTNSMIEIVESDSWSDDQLQCTGSNSVARNRFQNPHAIAQQGCCREYFAKKHFTGFARNWDENALFCAPAALDDNSCVDFVRHRKVTGDES